MKDQIVWFGDSWSANFQSIMPNTVANMLNLKLHNYAVSRAGWFEGPVSIPMQIEKALQNTNEIKYIVFYCGTNDYAHNHLDASEFIKVITKNINLLKKNFPSAQIHFFFNIRYACGKKQFLKLNPQIHLWRDVSKGIIKNNCGVPHLESLYWPINQNSMQQDKVHPTEENYIYIGAKVAQLLSGGLPQYFNSIDTKEIDLNGNKDVTGKCYFSAKDNRIIFDCYLNVKSRITKTTGIKVEAGLIPIEIFTNAKVSDLRNRICIPIAGNNSSLTAFIQIRMTQYTNGSDVFFLVPTNGNTIPAGSYNGHGEFVFFT